MVALPYDGRLRVNIAGIRMVTPVTTGSGTFGFGLEFKDLIDLNLLGAVTCKGTCLKPQKGNLGQRAVETPSGMLNAIGLENPGVDHFLEVMLPELSHYDVPVIVNIFGHDIEEYALVAQELDVEGVDAVEINISCPNVKEGGMVFGTQPKAAAEVVRAVKAATRKPVITKLSPNVTDIVPMAKAVEEAGTDAISLINTLLGMKIDIERRRPVLGNVTGGLSGPAVRPVALRLVWQVAQAVSVPIIGMGGIMCAKDAVEFMLAGASAVSVGTANFVNPRVSLEIAQGMIEYLDRHHFENINDIVGLALPHGKADMPFFNTKRHAI